MTSQELLDYIREQLNLGYSPEQTKNTLIQRGWRENEINEAFNSVRQVQPAEALPAPPAGKPPQETPPKEEPHKGGFSKKIILLIIVVGLLVVIGPVIFIAFGLYQGGVFDFGEVFAPNQSNGESQPNGEYYKTATGFTTFNQPEEWDYSGNELTLVIKNNQFEEGVTITEATAEGCDALTLNKNLTYEETFEFKFTGCEYLSQGENYNIDVGIGYKRHGAKYEHTSSGTISGYPV